MAVEDDERFKLSARFKRRRDKLIERDDRFNRVFKDNGVEARLDGPKVDPFGRPLDNIAIDEIYSSSEDEVVDAQLVEEEKEAIEYGDATERIAIVGCDWDNINADDLFVLFETIYKSINNNKYAKAVKRTAIYLSDFGHEKLNQEQIKGPSIEPTDDDEDSKQELVRKYQKERSRYYYGVVECDDLEKARLLYDELDGVEISYALDGLDLRFIPPDIEFSRAPKSESFGIPDNYEPPTAFQSALRHSRVECKWDTTPAKRFKTLTRRFTEQELAALDLSEYLASDDSDLDNVQEYKNLVKAQGSCVGDDQSSEECESDGTPSKVMSAVVGNYKISFGPDIVAAADELSVEEETIITDEEEESLPPPEDVRPSKRRHGSKKKVVDQDRSEEGRHFDMRSSKVQQKGFQSDFDDERIGKIFRDPRFTIDTMDPNYKKTEFNKKLLELKSKKK